MIIYGITDIRFLLFLKSFQLSSGIWQASTGPMYATGTYLANDDWG